MRCLLSLQVPACDSDCLFPKTSTLIGQYILCISMSSLFSPCPIHHTEFALDIALTGPSPASSVEAFNCRWFP